MRSVRYWTTVLLLSALIAAVPTIVMWAYYGWAVARVAGAATLTVLCLAALIGRQPQASRRRRWGKVALNGSLVLAGVAVALGVPGDKYRAVGIALLATAAINGLRWLWDRYVGKPSFGVGSEPI